MQNIQQMPWERETLLARLERQLDSAYDAANARRADPGGDLRTACYELAITRVLRAVELRGF